MDKYTEISYRHARSLTLHYSSSFGLASRLFDRRIRPHIYAVYGLVRIADEIVDTYRGDDSTELLDSLEAETYAAIKRGYSVNPIVHAFALTASAYHIDISIIAPFFKSMRLDLTPHTYTPKLYKEYIHGSAEVVGLMCLRVFCEGDDAQYEARKDGARALGAAYQKVNFLRDVAEDYGTLNRQYFPEVDRNGLDDTSKQAVIADIERDFARALKDIERLPHTCKSAVKVSYTYYSELLAKLKETPAATIRTTRVRISDARKMQIFAKAIARQTIAGK